jgi:hypothetical protein
MDIEKFKLELILKGLKLDHQAYDFSITDKQYYARIVSTDHENYGDEKNFNRDRRLGILNEEGYWSYFSWGRTEQEAINNVWLKWTTTKKS